MCLLVSLNTGMILVHSTLTNSSSRQWLAEMKQLAAYTDMKKASGGYSETTAAPGNCETSTGTGTGTGAAPLPLPLRLEAMASRYGLFEVTSLLEPHKERQVGSSPKRFFFPRAEFKIGTNSWGNLLQNARGCDFQNSVTMIRRRGFLEEAYSEPIYTKYA